jgi:hypothetical protein
VAVKALNAQAPYGHDACFKQMNGRRGEMSDMMTACMVWTRMKTVQ